MSWLYSGKWLRSNKSAETDSVAYVLKQLAAENCELVKRLQEEAQMKNDKATELEKLTQDMVLLDQRRIQEINVLRAHLSAAQATIQTRESEKMNALAQLERSKRDSEKLVELGEKEVRKLQQRLHSANISIRNLTDANNELQQNLDAEIDGYMQLEDLLTERDQKIEELLQATMKLSVPERKSYLSALASPPTGSAQHRPATRAIPSHDFAAPFDVQVLRLCRTGNIEDSKIIPAPLQQRVANASAGAYFQQYLPYIKEDVRSRIADELNELYVKPTKGPVAPVSSRVASVASGEMGGTRTLFLHTPANQFPKTDYGFNMEVICMHLPASRSGAKFVLGVACEIRDDDMEDEEDDQPGQPVPKGKKVVEISVKVLAQHFSEVAALPTVEWHWLCGLVPAQRMHAACSTRQAPAFFRYILDAQPTPWPVISAMAPEFMQRIKELNAQQQSVVAKLCGRTDGGLYCLVGPPGTGKTTTIVHLLHERVLQCPEERILLTAPSNKAVQVVMVQLLRKISTVPAVAFAGVPTTLPEEMEEFCAKKYASYLVTPLRTVGQQKANFSKMVSALEAARVEILARLDRLVQRHGLAVDKTVSYPVMSLIDGLGRMFGATQPKTATELKDFVATVRIYILLSATTLENYILQKAQIVFCTLVTSGRKKLAQLISGFDCVIVDEAAQALVPETFIPFKYNPRMCVLIGDPQQLPGMANSHQLRDLGYDASLMKIFTDAQSAHVETLNTQYRMHPSICKWTSCQFYDGCLVTGGDPNSRAKQAGVHHLISSTFVDCDFEEEKRAHGDITNVREAEVIMALTKHLLKQGVRPEQIGVITFYSAQVLVLKEMRARLAKELPQVKNILTKLVISTVDGFQGDERDITLVSCVRTIPSVGFLRDHRRINVALSRAKHVRWVFGCARALEASDSVLGDLLRWIDEPEENNTSPPTVVADVSDVCASIGYVPNW